MNAQSPRFSFTSDTVTLKKPDHSKESHFKVYKGAYTSIHQTLDKKAILGNYAQNNGELYFIPILPFQKNNRYTVVYENEVYPFTIDLDASYKHLQITEVYPNSDTLPSNFLKWYIQFSKPISPSKIYDHISLINNSDNTTVDRALLPLETPLLSDDGTLLTLWIEPGRQKRDLGPNERLGEVLIPGESYTLIIDEHLKDRQGISMKMNFKHSFSVSDPDRKKPSITSWKLQLPLANTKDPIILQYQEQLDYGSLQNTLQIVDTSGNRIKGKFIIAANQKNIYFTPLNNWNKNTYTLKCKPIIEDLSGNNLERLFDQDITAKRTPPILELSFSIE
ncbi:hypothetical protein GCM10011344_46090 [Dokdonia pacifica]|uniref:SbsA Ig-like domain-containing protein n=1 Tax=Dokdonia pacifica TaxID=1627892 RepID=A0A239DC32_9FLAO|nr:Ig-like domain-containing protein [Dokdonia pacifica]GGG40006.1 hypothetical protein GCM10011344_46090 [Dokdonia pacifica]SNS29857.1 hypothetical protein SAMN06265376_11093 [Dokdonia pacifica]